MNYRAEIDGLRALAVVSVILYHAKFIFNERDWFEGGFIGVDIFFVISGYLITYQILSDLENTNKFNLLTFYEKRARRIIPMLLFVIAVSIPFAWYKLLPLDLVDFSKSALSALAFGSNFFFYFSTTEYAADTALQKPLLHTWSLGVEEQFYIIAPIIFYWIWKFCRPFLLIAFIVMFFFSLQFSAYMNEKNSVLNFYLPFSRFWELLVGSCLAFLEIRKGRIKNTFLSVVGLFFILLSIFSFDSSTAHPSFETILPIAGVGLIIYFCSSDNFVGKLLSFKPFVGVGLISYSLYLWHFPIFAFSRIGSLKLSNFDRVEWILVAFSLSILSYFFVEKPFRNNVQISRKVFVSTIAIGLTALIFTNLSFIYNEGFKNRLPPLLLGLDNEKEKIEAKISHYDESLTAVYAIGDSHIDTIFPLLSHYLEKKFNLFSLTTPGCPLILGVERKGIGWWKNWDEKCSSDTQLERYLSIDKPNSIIVIGGRFPLYLSSYFFDNKEGGVEFDARNQRRFAKFESDAGITIEEAFHKTIKRLIAKGHQIVLIYPIPEVGVVVPKYILNSFRRNFFNNNTVIKPLTTNYNVYKERSKSTFNLFDSLSGANIYRVYPHTLFCNKKIIGRCITHDRENVYYVDDDHLSLTGSKMILELLIDQILAAERNIRQKKSY